MKTKFSLGLSLLSLFLGVAVASAADSSVHVKSSRNFRVLVIDSSKPDATRTAVHEAFANSLAASLRQGGIPLGVKLTEDTDADKVAEGLSSGSYDAALVFENTLPAGLRLPEFAVSRGFSEVGVPVRVFHLVLRNDDAGMVTFMTAAFGDTVKAKGFQDALTRSVAVRVVASNVQ